MRYEGHFVVPRRFSVIAQIFNPLYRSPRDLGNAGCARNALALPIENRRYSRLKICATLAIAAFLTGSTAIGAEWGSLRGNNRDTHAGGNRSAPAERIHPRTIPAPAPRIQPRSIPTPTGRQTQDEITRARERGVESGLGVERNRIIEPSAGQARDWEVNRARELERGRFAER